MLCLKNNFDIFQGYEDVQSYILETNNTKRLMKSMNIYLK